VMIYVIERPPPNHALQRNRRERRDCNGFARARSLSPPGLQPAAAFLSPFPKRLKCCVPWAGSLSLGR